MEENNSITSLMDFTSEFMNLHIISQQNIVFVIYVSVRLRPAMPLTLPRQATQLRRYQM